MKFFPYLVATPRTEHAHEGMQRETLSIFEAVVSVALLVGSTDWRLGILTIKLKVHFRLKVHLGIKSVSK